MVLVSKLIKLLTPHQENVAT